MRGLASSSSCSLTYHLLFNLWIVHFLIFLMLDIKEKLKFSMIHFPNSLSFFLSLCFSLSGLVSHGSDHAACSTVVPGSSRARGLRTHLHAWANSVPRSISGRSLRQGHSALCQNAQRLQRSALRVCKSHLSRELAIEINDI